MPTEQHQREEKRDKGMAHIKMKMDLLTKQFLSRNVEKVKIVRSQNKGFEPDSEQNANYFNTYGFSRIMAKKIRVKTMKERTIMTRLVIKTGNKGIKRVKETIVGCK